MDVLVRTVQMNRMRRIFVIVNHCPSCCSCSEIPQITSWWQAGRGVRKRVAEHRVVEVGLEKERISTRFTPNFVRMRNLPESYSSPCDTAYGCRCF